MIEILKYESIYIYGSYAVAPVWQLDRKP
jgi:hypothetical protein